MTNDNLEDNSIKSENKKDIFYRLINSKDNKEKIRILENFWLNEKRESQENVKIIRKGMEILEKGTDKEKIIALQVISRTNGFPLSDQLEEIFGMSGVKDFKKKDIDIQDITLDLDTSGDKPEWVYLTEEQTKMLCDKANMNTRS